MNKRIPALLLIIALASITGCAPKQDEARPTHDGVKFAQAGTDVFKNIDCNIVTVHSASSDAGASINWWTDGLGTRFNFPVDIFIDTGSNCDWTSSEAEACVTIQSNTICLAAKSTEYRIKRNSLHARAGSRGLIRITNAFDIDPKVNRLHQLGTHTISITVVISGVKYSGTAQFTIF